MRFPRFPAFLSSLFLASAAPCFAQAAPDMPAYTEVLAQSGGWVVARHIDPHEPPPEPVKPAPAKGEPAVEPPPSTRFCALYVSSGARGSGATPLAFMLVAGPQGWKLDSVRAPGTPPLKPGQQSALTLQAGDTALPFTMFNATPAMQVTYLSPEQAHSLLQALEGSTRVTVLPSVKQHFTLTLPPHFNTLVQALHSCVPTLGYVGRKF
ncbi:hypothetical protein [Oecophyllibacter saccharovorans]|uniref:hypothetical protein n=1 Tax=Oecophyllibacter saccharovorans TaxID=2558360 RepID=UPI00117435B0|nr:hypothetical protein [Oecophyllibacter saccharovorans]TPW35208.1 hypothetical protein E3203_07050 [Oecophyllibacter saccharovorans]